MSTTAIVTPYEPEAEKIRNELAVREEKAVAKFREEMRKGRLKGTKLPIEQCSKLDLANSTLTVNTGSMNLIRKAAESIGYKAQVLEPSNVQLVHADGSLLNVTKTNTGKISLSSTKPDLRQAKLIVREYTAMQVFNHLKSRGMDISARRTAQGEITIEAHVRNQNTVVTTDIRQDGIAVIDVSGMKGKGCQDIITGIKRAIEGSQIDDATVRKSEYFIEVDETRRINV